MPLARILTRHPQHTTDLRQELEKHGYTVEVLRPGQAGSVPADLEIDFEVCAQADALHRAAELAARWQADIAVAPAVLRSAAEPQHQPVIPSDPIPHQPAAVSSPQQTDVAATPAPVAAPVEPVPASIAADKVRPSASDLAKNVSARLNQAWQQGRPLLNMAGSTFQSWRNHAPEAKKKAGEVTAGFASQVAELSRNAWIALRTAGLAATVSIRHSIRAMRERTRIRAAQSRAQRQQSLLEMERHRAEAEQQARDLELARQAAAVRLRQLIVERGGPAQAQPAGGNGKDMPLALPKHNAAAQPPQKPVAAQQIKLRRRYSPQLEAILTGVAAAGALFIVGAVLASFQPRAALSHGVDQPYKGVTVQGGGVTLRPAPARVETSRPSPAIRSTARKPSPAQAARTTHQQYSRPQSDVRVDDSRDVSVRHFRQARKPATQSARRQTGMKHYSDLDN